MVLANPHLARGRKTSKRKENKLGSQCNTTADKRLAYLACAFRHSSRMATEPQAAECSQDTSGTETRTKSPITTGR